jgi:hypothetical protein
MMIVWACVLVVLALLA